MNYVNISTIQSYQVELTYLGRWRRWWRYSRVRRLYGWRQKQKDKKKHFLVDMLMKFSVARVMVNLGAVS